MEPTLTGTAALVTGASSGIGAATARRLVEHGASVALVARRRDRLEALGAEIDKAGGTALVGEADITDRTQAEEAVQQAVERFERLDTLVNNAGLMLLGPVVGADTEEWDRMIAINVQGLLYTTRAALPHLLQAAEEGPRRVADIVNISSIAGRVAWNGYGAYSFTKFGVTGFTEALRQEVTQRHVRVGVVEPGGVATELGSHNKPEVRNKMIDPFYEQTEVLAPEDIADGVALHGHPAQPHRHRRAVDHAHRPGLAATRWPATRCCPADRPSRQPQGDRRGCSLVLQPAASFAIGRVVPCRSCWPQSSAREARVVELTSAFAP
jgi:NADP-dependent 3-hydroxy acid dehydrogenase YdfG